VNWIGCLHPVQSLVKSYVAGALLLIALASGSPPKADPIQADHILVIKSARTLTLMRQGKTLKTFRVALGPEPNGPKSQINDGKTPEGNYLIDSKNEHSHYHLSLHVSYPNATDRARARKMGVNPGGEIMIHGLPPAYAWIGAAHRQKDWTLGCIAVTDAEIEEIWAKVPVGTPIEIRP
jgi:murein L,D-transpeptidase YafK